MGVKGNGKTVHGGKSERKKMSWGKKLPGKSETPIYFLNTSRETAYGRDKEEIHGV